MRTISTNEPTRYEIAVRIVGEDSDHLVLYSARKTKQMLREALRSDAVLARFEGCEYADLDGGIILYRDGATAARVRFTGYTQRDRRAMPELPALEVAR